MPTRTYYSEGGLVHVSFIARLLETPHAVAAPRGSLRSPMDLRPASFSIVRSSGRVRPVTRRFLRIVLVSIVCTYIRGRDTHVAARSQVAGRYCRSRRDTHVAGAVRTVSRNTHGSRARYGVAVRCQAPPVVPCRRDVMMALAPAAVARACPLADARRQAASRLVRLHTRLSCVRTLVEGAGLRGYAAAGFQCRVRGDVCRVHLRAVGLLAFVAECSLRVQLLTRARTMRDLACRVLARAANVAAYEDQRRESSCRINITKQY